MTTDAAARIDTLLGDADAIPHGPAERALLEEALALAVQEEDVDREYRVRMRLVEVTSWVGDRDAMLTSFAWCLGRHDADPARFPRSVDQRGSGLLYQYKWMASGMAGSPAFPLEQLRAVLDDIDERYRRAGLGRSGPLATRFGVAVLNGWADEAAAAYTELQATERDDHADCDACVSSDVVRWFVATGREDDAVRMSDEMVERGLRCVNEPARALGDALVPMLRAGRLGDARAVHLRSYRAVRRDPDMLRVVARHVEFCVVTGNLERALAILERHLGWLGHDPLDGHAHFEGLAAAALALDAVAAAGRGDTVVRGSGGPELAGFVGEHDGPWRAGELAPAAWAAAERLAVAFDARNGTARYAERLAAVRALADERYDVPVEREVRSAVVPVEVAGSRSAGPGTAGSGPAGPGPQEPEPADARGWAGRARERGGAGDDAGALAAVERGLAVAGDDADARAALLRMRLRDLVSKAPEDDAALLDGALLDAGRLAAERVAALRAAGHDVLAGLEERFGLALVARRVPEGGTPAELAAELDAAAHEAAQAGAAAAAAEVSYVAAFFHERADDLDGMAAAGQRAYELAARGPGRADELWEAATYVLAGIRAAEPDGQEAALTLLAELLEGPDGVPNRALRADALRLRARVRAGAGDLDGAFADASGALELDVVLGARERASSSALLEAAILGDLGRRDEAVGVLRLAVQQAELAESDGVLGARYSLGRALVAAGRADEGLDVLQDVLDAEVAAQAPAGARAETLEAIGHASRAAGEPGSAAESWSSAADLFDEAEAPGRAAQVRRSNAHLHLEAGYARDAVELLEEALVGARSWGHPQLVVDVLHSLGQAQAAQRRPEALESLDEAIGIARQHEVEWLVADLTDSRARALGGLSRWDDAVADALGASDLFLAAGDGGAAGGSLLLAARLLADATRPDEAVPLYRAAADQLEDRPDERAVAWFELADVLDGLGRAAEAAEARTAAEAAGAASPAAESAARG